VAEPQSRVVRDAALAVDDPGDPVHRVVNLARQFGRGNAEFF
jgi:hypothetical protein